ncbi:hypothetical protein DKG75_06550 [Zavarzinia compransoris]|uniref:NAD(P)-dependent oxidoreductase n=2 Tax=Zavarzinia compransoris TaxID=1264899 RepID=A0A317E633_9PROT|nr:hypothetical protein DKG75_06550 [Zavarzinia compransoris]
MGLRMATRLAETDGIELTVYDLDPARMASLEGKARLATSIADAAAGAEGIFSVVPADQHTLAVVGELEKVIQPGQAFVDFSTIGPATIEAVGRRLAEKGAQTISAGMTKSLTGAATGTLSLFVGGPDEIPAALKPAFDAMASDIMMVGSLGAAKALKLVNNMVVATLDVAMTEALALGAQFGIPFEQVTGALAAGGGDNWPLHNHIVPHVLPDVLGPGFFGTRFLMKDLKLYTAFARSQNLPAFFAGAGLAAYRGAAAHGFGEHYHMIIVRWYERGARVGERPASPLPDGLSAAEVTARLVAGVAAIQALVSAEALRILARMGLGQKAAAFYLDSGSAGNDSLRALVRTLEGGNEEAVTPARLLADLDQVAALADKADVPGAVFEVGRHLAASLIDRHGEVTDLWRIAAA